MNRRTFVKTGVAATVGASAPSLSGCSQLPLVGSGGAYTKWLHEPGEIGSADHYTVSVHKPETIFANEEAFDCDRVDDFEASYD